MIGGFTVCVATSVLLLLCLTRLHTDLRGGGASTERHGPRWAPHPRRRRDSPARRMLMRCRSCPAAAHRSLLALLTALAARSARRAASARAQVSWVVHGHGFGHGVGMSAYGAYGYALHGKGYEFILGHYYPGTALGQIPGPRSRPRPARRPPRRRQLHRRDQRLPDARSNRPAPTRRTGSRRPSCCAPPAASRSPAAGRSCAPPATAGIDIAGLGRYRGALETVADESGER